MNLWTSCKGFVGRGQEEQDLMHRLLKVTGKAELGLPLGSVLAAVYSQRATLPVSWHVSSYLSLLWSLLVIFLNFYAHTCVLCVCPCLFLLVSTVCDCS